MTRKDYELFAKEIKKRFDMSKEWDVYAKRLVINFCIDVFKQDNPRFDESRFSEACREEGV